MAKFYTDSSGRHRPLRGRSLFAHPSRSRLFSEEIHWDTPTDAHHSVAFANKRWSELRSHKERVHLIQAMNEAANRAKVSKGENSEEHRVLRAWVNEHKGKSDGPKADPPVRKVRSQYTVVHSGPSGKIEQEPANNEAAAQTIAGNLQSHGDKVQIFKNY